VQGIGTKRGGQTWQGHVLMLDEKPSSLLGKKNIFLSWGSTGPPRCKLDGVEEGSASGVTANRGIDATSEEFRLPRARRYLQRSCCICDCDGASFRVYKQRPLRV
jgi:hypothetical protein